MKKLISLLISVCMCFSVCVMLTACSHEHTYQTEWSKDTTHHWHACEWEDCTDVADKAEHTWNDGEITKEATAEADGVKTFTCTVCDQTKTEVVKYTTTIAKEDWISILTYNNYTINSTAYEGDNTFTIIMKATEKAMLQSYGQEQTYVVLQDGEWYLIYMSNDGNTGKKQSGFPGNTIGALYFGTNEADKLAAIYDLLIYNDVEKCYYVTGLEVDDDLEYRIYFENGHISKIRIDETGDYQIMTVSDIGTTTIDNIPEWTVAS